MKIITENSIYIQRNDIVHLCNSMVGKEGEIPNSIIDKIYGHGIVFIGDSNRHEFVEFKEQEEIDFFNSRDWIIDYNTVKTLKETELVDLAWHFTQQKQEIANKYNDLNANERIENYHMVVECSLLDHKINSLIDMSMYNKGKVKIELPIENKKSPNRLLQKIREFKRGE